MNDSFKIGKGAYGKVYRVKLENGKWCALKQQHQDTFEDFSKVFIETSFHLLTISDRHSSHSFARYVCLAKRSICRISPLHNQSSNGKR